MNCNDPKMRRLVSLYQFNLLSEHERFSVEDHLLDCDACFEEVYRMSKVSELLEQEPQSFLDALQPKKSGLMLIRGACKTAMADLINFSQDILDSVRGWMKIPAVKVLISAAAVVLFIILFVRPFKKDFSHLAIIESASYVGGKVRGLADEFSSTQTLYDEGMKYYQQKNYRLAIQKLDSFVRRKKEDPYGHFYLGVSYLMRSEFKKGVKHLETASALCQKQNKQLLGENTNWHLSNAYLKINEVEKAIRLLNSLAVTEGEYKEPSLKLLMKISELKAE